MSSLLRIVPGNELPTSVIGDLFERAFDEPYGTAAVTDLTKSPATWSLVGFAEPEGLDVPVGFVIGMKAADMAEIYSIGVPPEYRRKGYARALLANALEACSSDGAETVYLEVAADNGEAIRLYERSGFRQDGRRKNYYRRGNNRIDAIMMARGL